MKTPTSRALAVFFLCAFAVPSKATDFYVALRGAGDGSSWSSPLGDVQVAIDACAASGGGTVRIAQGTYRPTSQPNISPATGNSTDNHFALKSGVTVSGGFITGNNTPQPLVYPTVLSGDLAQNDEDTDGDGFVDLSTMSENCRHVFYHPATASVDPTAKLEGVIVSGGCDVGSTLPPGGGGGMHNAEGISPVITNCIFRYNYSAQSGGGFFKRGSFSSSAPILDKCTFVGNQGSFGGGASLDGSSGFVTNSTFLGNAATDNGGGIAAPSGSIKVQNCTIVGNKAPNLAGGVLTAAAQGCIFWGNWSYSGGDAVSGAVSYSIVQDGYPGTGNLDKDPLLLPLNNYGGNVTTMALRGDSPAIDGGVPGFLPPRDQRGYRREAKWDIGAYEYQRGPVIYVKQGGTGSGSSWANASGNLTAAISTAAISPSYQTEIWVAGGTYRGTISLRSGISVYGGFNGSETALGQRDIAATPTILSADMNGDDADSDGDGIPDSGTSENTLYVCLNSVASPSAMLDGFILSGAKRAAIRNAGSSPFALSSPTIANCAFRHNTGQSASNGIYSAAVFLSCAFHHNAGSQRVVINETNSAPTLANCAFLGSSTQEAPPLVANLTQTTSPKIFNCTFAPGASQAAVYNSSGAIPKIRNCIIWGNAGASGIVGGSPAVSYCVIQGGFGEGTSIITQDPLLLPFGNYGGPTPTMPLGSGNQAANQGVFSADVPYADQRGFSRSNQPDIGACEFQNPPRVYVTGSELDDGTIGYDVPTAMKAYADGMKPGWRWFWYFGKTGDTSLPVDGTGDPTADSSVTLPPLVQDASVWVRLDYGNGYSDSPTFQLTVVPAIFVTSGGDDNNDGRTWATAKHSISAAISAASERQNIWVAKGTYIVGNTPLLLKSGVSVYGGFAGNETRSDQRDIPANPTILSGDLRGNDADYDRDGYPDPATTADNAPAIFLNQLVQNSTLDGLEFAGAREGAVINVGSSPTISNCTFRWNSTGGSGIYASGSVSGTAISNLSNNHLTGSFPKIVGCTFEHNIGSSSYGSSTIANDYSSPTITNCTFYGNRVGSSWYIATAIYDEDNASSIVTNCTFSANSGDYPNYPVVMVRGAIRNSIFWDNSGTYDSGTTDISHCIVEGGLGFGANITSADPLLLPLGHYGGATETMPIGAGSYAVNHGGSGTDIPLLDQRGFTRDAAPDIGACEWQANLAFVNTLDGAASYIQGERAVLDVVSESSVGSAFQWFVGPVGDTSRPAVGATRSRFVTDPLIEPLSFWVKVQGAGASAEAGIALSLTIPHVIHVAPAGSDMADGSTWQSAKQSLYSALSASWPGDHIWVAGGTYRTAGMPLSLRDNVSIYGGFSGNETRMDQRNIAANSTVLSADRNGNDADSNGDGVPDSPSISDNDQSVFVNDAVATTAKLDGFVITGATSAAVYNIQSSPLIANCEFRGNPGSAILNSVSGSPTIRGCTFHRNGATHPVFRNLDGCSSFLVNCTFGLNGMPPDVYFNSTAFLQIINCTFSLRAGQSAVWNSSSGLPTIRNTIIWGSALGITGPAAISDSVIQSGYGGGTRITAQDPLLMALGDYGGPMLTMPVASRSPTINAGVSGTDVPALDQRGFVRDAMPDIGACEFGQGIVALVGEAPSGPASMGSPVSVKIYSDGPAPFYQWYYGVRGDTSHPVPGGTGETLQLWTLGSGVKVWARVWPGGGVPAVDTAARTIEVRGTFDDWCNLHGLSGGERDPQTSVAGDSMCNLLKFALGLPPRNPAAQSDVTVSTFEPATNLLSQEWTVSKTPSDLSLRFEYSDDLKSWTIVTPSLVGEDEASRIWKVMHPISAGGRGYLRLRAQK